MIDHGALVAAEHGLTRSSHWPKVEHAFKMSSPSCAACGSKLVQVHHVLPFHFAILLGRPDLELDSRNLITLCETEQGQEAQDHHLLLGHLDDFKSYNPAVRVACVTHQGQSQDIIRADAGWLDASQHKPLEWSVMTDGDKQAMRELMDSWYPLEEGGTHGSQPTSGAPTSTTSH